MSTISQLFRKYSKPWRILLVEPLASVHQRGIRRHARLMSATLLVLLITLLLESQTSGSIPRPFFILVGLAYLLSRTTYYQIAAPLTIILFSALPFLVLGLPPEAPHSYTNLFMWTAIPIVLSGMLLSIRGLIFVGLGNLGAISLLPIFTAIEISEIVESIGFIGTVAIVVILITWQKALVEHERQEEIARREEQIRAAVTAANIGTWSWDVESDNLSTSMHLDESILPAGIQIPTTGTEYFSLIDLQSRSIAKQRLQQIIHDNKSHYEAEHRLQTNSPNPMWVEIRGRLFRDASGRPVRMTGTVADISERKRIQDLVARRANEMETLYEMSLAISIESELTRLLEMIINKANVLIGLSGGVIALVDENQQHLIVAAEKGSKSQLKGRKLALGEGFLGTIAQEDSLQILDDRNTWPEPHPEIDKIPIGRALGHPLKHRGRQIGVLALFDFEHGYFEPNAVQLIGLFANYAAIAIENARFLETEVKQRSVAESLGVIGRLVNSDLDLNRVLTEILTQLEELLAYDAAHVILVEGKDTRLVASNHFEQQEALYNQRIPLSRLPFSSRAFNSKRPILISDTQLDPEFKPIMRGSRRARSLILVPLISRDKVIAILTIISYTPEQYQMSDVNIAFRFGQQVAMAVQNAQLMATVSNQRDDLEARVTMRTAELERAKDQAEAANKAKSRFLQNVTHELRTPLNAILGFSQIIQMRGSTTLEDQRDLEIIKHSGEQLLALVNSILNNSRIDNTEPSPPLEIPPRPQIYEAPPERAENRSPLKFLIVDDQPYVQEVLKLMLAPFEANIQTADDGQEAIDIFSKWHPDLIIMDQKLPLLDGATATRRIRQMPKSDSTIIIATSATDLKEVREEAISAGSNDFLPKPFEPQVLETLLRHYFYYQPPTVQSNQDAALVPAKVPHDLNQHQLATCPPDWIASLKLAAAASDQVKMRQLIDEIAETHHPLSIALRQLVEEFATHALLQSLASFE